VRCVLIQLNGQLVLETGQMKTERLPTRSCADLNDI
jgi:hypothetical protein